MFNGIQVVISSLFIIWIKFYEAFIVLQKKNFKSSNCEFFTLRERTKTFNWGDYQQISLIIFLIEIDSNLIRIIINYHSKILSKFPPFFFAHKFVSFLKRSKWHSLI